MAYKENRGAAKILDKKLAKMRKTFATLELKHKPKGVFRKFPHNIVNV